MNINTVAISGNLTADANVREYNDKKFASFTVAVNGVNDRADFIRCNAFGKTAEFIEEHVKKGAKVAISGKLCSKTFDKSGVKVTTVEVDVQNLELIRKAGEKTDAPAEDFVPVEDEDAELPFN